MRLGFPLLGHCFAAVHSAARVLDHPACVRCRTTRSQFTPYFFHAWQCPAVSIDDRAIGHLAELSPQQAIEVLDKFEVGLSKGDVRNPSAFLSSGIRRQSQPRGPSLHELAPQAQQVLEQLYESGPVKRTDLDAKCMRLLANHPPEFQVLALDTFAERNLLGVRNVAGWWGVARAHKLSN